MTINISQSRQHVAAFLQTNPVGVLATTTLTNKPHAAAVYIVADDLLNLYFITKQDTQKNRNLSANHQVALAAYNADSQTTLQTEGTVEIVTDAEHRNQIFADISNIALRISKSGVPPTARLIAGAYIVYKLTPSSMRLASFSQPQPGAYDQIFETVET